MTNIRSKAAAAVLIALGLSLLAAGPATAFTPAGTATLQVAPLDANLERSRTLISGECPATTVFVSVELTFTGVNSGSIVYPTYNPVDGTYSQDFQLDDPPLVTEGRGTAVQFTARCVDAVPAVIATEIVNYTLPDFGQTVAAPASQLSTVALPVTADCGTVTADTIQFAYTDQLSASHGDEVVPYVGAGLYTLTSPGGLGFVAGDTITLTVSCYGAGGTHFNSSRLATIAVTAPAAAPAPAPSGPTLAESGVDTSGWMLAGLLFLVSGVGILILRRRRTA